jgi:SAM-dependent methyltransferase
MEIINTHNGYGWTTTVPNQITVAFFDLIASSYNPLVLDVGCGFGVATLPALALGAQVIANDLEPSHLSKVREKATEQGLDGNLTTVEGRYPDDLSFTNLAAIHSSNVLQFLKGAEIERGAAAMFDWLRPGGRAFIQVGTVFAGHVKLLVPVFEDNLRRGVKWPGETDNAHNFVMPEFWPAIPDRMNFLSGPPLVEAYENVGFEVEKSWYYTRVGLGPPLANDGRENFGLILRKPITKASVDRYRSR